MLKCCFFIFSFILIVHAYGQNNPVSIELQSFQTSFNSTNEEVDIHWETGQEVNISHYNLYRSMDPYADENGTKINSDPIYATGGSVPASYDYTDIPSFSGRYYYTLEEVSTEGQTGQFDPTTTEKHVDVYFPAGPHQDVETINGNGWYHFNEGTDTGDSPGDGHTVEVEILAGDIGELTVTQTNQAPANAPGANVAPYQWDFSGDVANEVRISFYYDPGDISGVPENSDYIGIAQYNANSQTWNWRGGTVDSVNHKVTLQTAYATGKFALYLRIYGDVSGDGYVDAIDLQKFGDVWQALATGEFTEGSDAYFFNFNKTENNGQQIIDAADLQVFGDTWNNGGNY